jgi:hypothetical protein
MEVHHHPIAIGSHSSRKNWGSYFWEFVMLFLAVFCGFLAEYQLEHKIEKERGKQYTESFYEDLKKDTARLGYLVGFETNKIASLNKLQECYDSILKNEQPASFLEIMKNSLSNTPFLMDGRTLRQLTNAGGFRLLQKEDADSIISYEKNGNNFEDYQSTLYQQAQDNLRNTFSEVIDFAAYTTLYTDIANNPLPDALDIKAPLVLTSDKRMLNKYFNQLFQYLRATVQHRNRLRTFKEQSERLISYFKDKYHFN